MIRTAAGPVGREPWVPKAVFFDFDGVILESLEVKRNGFRLLFADYGEEICDAAVSYDHANPGMSRFDKFRWCCEMLLDVGPTEEFLVKLDRRFSALILERVLVAEFVPGAREFLERWSGFLPFFVVSAAPQPEVRHVVRQRGLAQHFVSVHGSPVSKATWVGTLLERHGLRASDAVMVGDAVSDFDAAAANEVAFVARIRPDRTERFEPARCLACVPDLRDLGTVLGLDHSPT